MYILSVRYGVTHKSDVRPTSAVNPTGYAVRSVALFFFFFLHHHHIDDDDDSRPTD